MLNTLDTNDMNRTYIEQLLALSANLSNDGFGELELKILTNAMKEIHYAFEIFRKYDDRKKISVFGSARSEPGSPNYRATESFTSKATNRGYMIISGAGPGIMEAANRGAGREQSFGLQISTPGEDQANPIIDGDEKCINFRFFFSRKLLFAKESSASVFFPGGLGTHDELFELLCLMQTGHHHLTPLILCDRDGYWENLLEYLNEPLLEQEMIDGTDMQSVDYVTAPGEALEIIDNFYGNYHSSRFLDEEYIIRFHDYPSDRALEKLEDEFIHLCPESGFRVESGPLEGEESGAPEELHRLIFHYTNQDYGELRRLVDALNDWNRNNL